MIRGITGKLSSAAGLAVCHLGDIRVKQRKVRCEEFLPGSHPRNFYDHLLLDGAFVGTK